MNTEGLQGHNQYLELYLETQSEAKGFQKKQYHNTVYLKIPHG